MKLTYIAHIRLPTGRAHGYAIMKMCEQFAAHGASVELLVSSELRGHPDDPFDHYGIERNFTIERLWTSYIRGSTEFTSIPFLIDLCTFLVAVYRRTYKPDEIVYTRDYAVALIVPAQNIVLELHDIPSNKRVFARALSRVQRFVVITHALERALIERGVPKERITVAPDAVDLAEFDIVPDRAAIWREFGVDPSKKLVLYTGHFYGWKGAETLADAARYVNADVEIILMGGIGQELADFQQKYTAPHIHVIPFVRRERLARILKSADILVLPNSGRAPISAHYTSPLKLFQYMASGVPIIASDLPSIREILDDATAYWFTPDDPRSLAAKIEAVLNEPEAAGQKALAACERAKRYTWRARAQSILNGMSAMAG